LPGFAYHTLILRAFAYLTFQMPVKFGGQKKLTVETWAFFLLGDLMTGRFVGLMSRRFENLGIY
jgi:hypothetical protein